MKSVGKKMLQCRKKRKTRYEIWIHLYKSVEVYCGCGYGTDDDFYVMEGEYLD